MQEELGGGELAATLSCSQRMELIQRGGNPFSPEDVRAFQEGKRPSVGLSSAAGINDKRFSNLGERGTFIDGKHITYNENKDYAILAKEGIDTSDLDSHEADLPPRERMKRQMGSYGENFGGDVNDKILAKLHSSPSRSVQETRQPQRPQPSQTRGPISQPRHIEEQPQLLTEAVKAKQLGETKGAKYINAFIELMKAPNSANRAKLIEEINRMVVVEERIHSSVLPQYRQGLASAETIFYNKIKALKK